MEKSKLKEDKRNTQIIREKGMEHTPGLDESSMREEERGGRARDVITFKQ
jgi:hypothetical protein